MASVHDVAAAILSTFDRSISTMKLQKLVYLSQGWSLALRDRPLFDGNFEAWANGPVSRDLFRNHRTLYSVSRWPEGDPNALSADDRLVVHAVLQNYGALSGKELSELTHVSGTPWTRARSRAGVAPGSSSREPLRDDEMKEHFQQLLLNGSRAFQQLTAGRD